MRFFFAPYVLCPAAGPENTAGVNPSSDSLHRTVAPNPPSDPDSLRLSRIDSELAALVGRDSTFRREVDVTSGRLSLSELLRNIARASGVNMSVRSVENIPVSCNFRRARVDDLVRFLCREYRLDVAASGNILSIFPAAAPTVPAPDPDVAYAAADTTLTYDLRGERLIDVAKKIARLSARNVIVPEPLYDCKVSGYVRRMPFDDALRTLAAVNGLLAERDAQEVWTLWREEPAAQGGKASAGPAYMRRRQFTPNELRVDSLGRITARIARGDVQDVILDLCDELELNYYFQSPVNLTAGVWVDGTDFETLLSVLLKGSPYSYYTERGHLDLRSGRVGRSLVGDGTSARLPRRVEGRGDHPRGAETERRGEDLPRSERPDPVGRPARRGACGDLSALGGQTRSDGDDGDPDRRRHEEQDPRDRSGGRRGRQSGEDLRNAFTGRGHDFRSECGERSARTHPGHGESGARDAELLPEPASLGGGTGWCVCSPRRSSRP